MQNAQSIEQAMRQFVQALEQLRAHVGELQATSAAHELKLKEITDHVRDQTDQTNKERAAERRKRNAEQDY